MITRVRVKNFRSIADVDVELGPLTVLVGRNGAGKSAFVDVLRFVRDSIRTSLDAAIIQRHGFTSLRRWPFYGRQGVEITVTAEAINFWGEYSFALIGSQDGEYRVRRESCLAGTSPETINFLFELRNGKWINTFGDSIMENLRRRSIEPTALILSSLYVLAPSLANLYSSLAHTEFYSIYPNTLREPQKPANETFLEEHGENLASVLRKMKKQNTWFPDLLTALNQVTDGVSDVRVRQIGGYLVVELKHEGKNGHSPWFELAQESDGTLRLLGLLVALYHNTDTRLIAIEEPELTLHPGALGILSEVLREASQRTQILITTQSPDLISRFNADEIRVVERVDGVTKIGPIEETQREVINDQLFSAGDLLRIEGLHRAPVEAAGGGNA